MPCPHESSRAHSGLSLLIPELKGILMLPAIADPAIKQVVGGPRLAWGSFLRPVEFHLTARPPGLASPLDRPPRVLPRAAELPLPRPTPLAGGADTRDGLGVCNLGVPLEDLGGFSTKDVSVVLGRRYVRMRGRHTQKLGE